MHRLTLIPAVLVSLVQIALISADYLQNQNDAKWPIVDTKCGKIEGKILSTPKGQCDAYLGVPFATPSVGEYRWKKPQPVECWTGIRSATEPGPACIQTVPMGINTIDPKDQSEDCLYLNILVPKTAGTSSEKLPVMVSIHGGGFTGGSAREYGLEGPCENLALRGVIVVIIQYRLSIYGFLSTGDDVASGNFGLWDQIESLRWVSKNIESFGGDPKRVTIFGASAGGASVSFLTYTPVAQDLFQQAIAQSGSGLAGWAALRDSSIATAKKVALAANCTDPESKSYIECLRKFSTADLQVIYNSAVQHTFSMDFAEIWSIRADKELFPQAKLNELTSKKPIIIGATSLEMPLPESRNIASAKTVFSQTLDNTFRGSDPKKNELLKILAQHTYINSKGDPNNDTFVEQQRALFEANLHFHAAPAAEATLKAANGQPVWVYNFDYWTDTFFGPDYPFQKGGAHGHECCYLYLMDPPPWLAYFVRCPKEYTGKDRQVADYLGEMWTSFAKKGDPSSKDLVWPKFKSVADASTMVIRSNLSIEPHFYLESSSFWNQLVPSIKDMSL